MLTVTELEAMEAALTIKGACWLLGIISVCATILFIVVLRRYAKDRDQEHAERMAAIQSSKDIGQTAWAHSDVHKTEIIRQQQKRIAELEAWKDRVEKRWGETTIEQFAREMKSGHVQVL